MLGFLVLLGLVSLGDSGKCVFRKVYVATCADNTISQGFASLAFVPGPGTVVNYNTYVTIVLCKHGPCNVVGGSRGNFFLNKLSTFQNAY